MNSPISFRGLIVDLITPFKGNGNIDGRGLGRLLDRILPHAQGVLLAGPSMGEGKDLEVSQRTELLEKSLVVIRGRLPILIWITGRTREKTEETLAALEKCLDKRKYEGRVIWVDTPLYYHSNRGLFDHYRELCSHGPLPFILHNDPELIRECARPLKRVNIRTSILKELARLKGIQGLIFLGSSERVRNYQRAARSGAGFRILDGDESRFLDYPSMGGLVSAGANLTPRAWQKITISSLDMGESEKRYPDRLKQLWATGKDLRRMIDLYRDDPVPLIKQVLADKGLIDSPTCASGGEFKKENVDRIKEVMTSIRDYS